MTLLSKVLGVEELSFDGPHEAAWVEVIRKMDEVYSDLIRYEVDLEEKNVALAQAQRFISSVLESVSDVLIVCERDGTIVQVNRAFATLIGDEASVFVGAPLSRYLVPEAQREILAKLISAAPGRELRDLEVRFEASSGPSDLFAINGSARLDQRGRRAGFVLTGRPIGELRRAYEALHQAHGELQRAQQQLVEQEKMASLGRLVAGVAHELNNPISFVYGNVHALEGYRVKLTRYLGAIHEERPHREIEALRDELRIDAMIEDLPALLAGLNEGAARVSDIVKNLRRLSFAERGEPGDVALEPLVETAVRWVRKSDRRDVAIDLAIERGVQVRGHEGQLHQVLVNLIQNALDAVRSVARPRIAIVAGQEKGTVRIDVADNGSGVPEAIRGRIFDPFFTTKGVGEGTGLGLWISYSIVKEHGGRIEVGASDEGGACMRVSLPR